MYVYMYVCMYIYDWRPLTSVFRTLQVATSFPPTAHYPLSRLKVPCSY